MARRTVNGLVEGELYDVTGEGRWGVLEFSPGEDYGTVDVFAVGDDADWEQLVGTFELDVVNYN